MDNYKTYFGCRYPIICAPMNQVSDARLAIAVFEAGAFPSLSVANYLRNGHFDMAAYVRELTEFKRATGSDGLLLSVGGRLLMHDAIVDPFLDLGFRHFELFHWAHTEAYWPALLERSHYLEQRHGAKFMFKVSSGHLKSDLRDYQTIILKGPEGAGRSAEDALPLDEAFARCREDSPGTSVIVSGGIHSADQVREYLDRGGLAVAIGTLIAASRESSVSVDVKHKLIAAQSAELRRAGPTGLKGLFTSIATTDDRNLTRTLALGVRSPDDGGIFAGDAIDHITAIYSVREIVERLMGSRD